MDNLSRTSKDLSRMQLDYLNALKKELEAAGTGLLNKMDQVNEENQVMRASIQTL